MGDETGEGHAYGKLGDEYHSLGDFKLAIEFYQKQLGILKEVGDRVREACVYGKLGEAYESLRNFVGAIECHKKYLNINREMGNRAAEGTAYSNLGNACQRLGNFKQAIEYHKQQLTIAREVEDRSEEGAAYCGLGKACYGLGDFKQAIGHHNQHLTIAKELGDRAGEGVAYCNLGICYHRLGDFKQAIEYHNQDLTIAKEAGDRAGEGTSYGNLGNCYHSVGDFKKAIDYHSLHLSIAKEVGDRAGEGTAYCNIGRAYRWLGDFKQAVGYHMRDLSIAKELNDRAGEGTTYGNLGNTYQSIGDFKQAIKYHKLHLSIAKEVEDRAGEGHAYGDLGRAYHGIRDFKQSIECHNQHINIAKEVGNRAGEGRAYGNLGRAYHDIGNFKQAINCHYLHLGIAKEVGDRVGEGTSYGKLGNAFESLGEFEKAMEYHKQHLSIAKEVGHKAGEGTACYALGRVFEITGSLHEAVVYFRSSVEVYSSMKALLKDEDSWKIHFNNIYQDVFTALSRTLLKLQNKEEALCVAEQGRAQALVDLIKLQYNFRLLPSASEAISNTLSDAAAQTVFVALDSNTVNLWVLCRGTQIHFRQNPIEGDDAATFVHSLVENFESVIQPLDELQGGLPSNRESGQEIDESSQGKNNPLRLLYDTVICPVADLLHDDELIIVPDGPLCLAPYAAFVNHESRYLSECFRIRIVPSLTCLKLITDCPESYHNKNGALLVGNPCMEEVACNNESIIRQLPGAGREVEIIGEILKTKPLTGHQATKDEVLKRIGSVALVHIAAHAELHSGEIALAPNPARKSKIPKEEDYVLTAKDVQAVKLRARLVVLSCCHSTRARQESDVTCEGLVGIARAFLGAGARSVLVSHWRIDDEATIDLMRRFYQHLVDGKSTGVALHHAMKCLRESDKFGAVKFWAPFILIGDDVRIEFGGERGAL